MLGTSSAVSDCAPDDVEMFWGSTFECVLPDNQCQRVLNEVYVFDNEHSYVIRQQLVLGSSTCGFQNRSVNKVYHHFTGWYRKKKKNILEHTCSTSIWNRVTSIGSPVQGVGLGEQVSQVSAAWRKNPWSSASHHASSSQSRPESFSIPSNAPGCSLLLPQVTCSGASEGRQVP